MVLTDRTLLFSVMGAEIPDVANKKDWGSYEIKGLSVESM